MNFCALFGYIVVGILAIAIGMLMMPEVNQTYTVPDVFPLFFARIVLADVLRRLLEAIAPHYLQVVADTGCMGRASIVNALAYHRIPDMVHQNKLTTEEIAAKIGSDSPQHVLRWLRAAEGFGYLHQDVKTGVWTQSAYSDLLRTDHPNSLWAFSRHFDLFYYEAYGDLKNAMVHGSQDSFSKLHNGLNLFDYLQTNPEHSQLFADAMSNGDSFVWYAQVHDFDWGQYKRVIDFVGSRGHFLARILNAYPRLQGVLFDRPEIIEQGKEIWQQQHTGLLNRFSIVSGSFFELETLPEFVDGDVC